MKILRNDVVELIRPSKGEYNEDREWVLTLSDSAPINLKCSIQPEVTGFSRIIETSGARTEDCLQIYTTTKLQSSDEGKTLVNSQGQPNDIIVVDDSNYLVFKVLKWRGARKLSHYNCLLIKEDAFGNINEFKESP